MRTALLVLVMAAISGCQSAEPPPSAQPAGVPAPLPTSPMPEASPVPTSPFPSDGYDYAVIETAIRRFVADLAALYRDPDPDAIRATFTTGGLKSALAIDWRLRSAVDSDTAFLGDLSVRGFTTIREEPRSSPPILESDVSMAIAPGAALVDRTSGMELQRWDQKQIQDFSVLLRYDTAGARWVIASMAAPSEPGFSRRPATPGPAVRCAKLGGDHPDTSVVEGSRPWCFGGREGTKATDDQISILDHFPCGESPAAITTIGWPVGATIDWWEPFQFVSDPDGLFHRHWPLAIPYLGDTRLPKDAYSTGLTDGEFEIWVSPSAGADAVWAKRTSRIERWPRAPKEWGVTDCN